MEFKAIVYVTFQTIINSNHKYSPVTNKILQMQEIICSLLVMLKRFECWRHSFSEFQADHTVQVTVLKLCCIDDSLPSFYFIYDYNVFARIIHDGFLKIYWIELYGNSDYIGDCLMSVWCSLPLNTYNSHKLFVFNTVLTDQVSVYGFWELVRKFFGE